MVLVRWPYAALALQMLAGSGLALPQTAETPYSATNMLDVARLSTNDTVLEERFNPVALGVASSIIGLIAATEGMTAASISLAKMFAKKSKNQVVVRFTAGKVIEENDIDGNTPSIVLFDAGGHKLGHSHQNGHRIKEGNYRDVTVKTPGTNERPEYIAIIGQNKDAICLSAVFITYSDGYDGHSLLGDTIANCGGSWAWSTNLVGDHPTPSACGWVGPWTGSDVYVDRPNGWSWHIPDFHATDARVDQYQREPKTMCEKDARFQLHYSLGNEDEDTIPIFENLPLPLNDNATDVDTFYFGFLGTRRSDPIGHTLARRASEHDPDIEDRWKRYLFRSLEKGLQSAKLLCNSPTSLSADWFSYNEDQLCHMETRELFRRCQSDDDSDCFDFKSDQIWGKQDCGAGELCPRGRLGHRVIKAYELVADATKGENARFGGSI